MQTKASVLVVEDDEALGEGLMRLLDQAGHAVTWVPSAEAALKRLERVPADLVLSDLRMPGLSGLELLKLLKERLPELPVVLITAHGTVPLAVEAMRAGAADFMLKPFAKDEVMFVIAKALAGSLAARNAPPAPPLSTGGLVGASPVLDEARALIRRAAASQATVLLLGETGTGKEVAARAIHEGSSRAGKPFMRVNCGALPEALIESELFGHEKGAFTSSVSRRQGRVELAQGGTLFLDEIGDLSLPSQVKLLRLLQEREFERVGGTETLQADVRVLAATHRDLAGMVKEGTFREDLLYRLDVIPITLPPLRDRPGDVTLLTRHFLGTLGRANHKPRATLALDALALLERQPWPGNVRQLQNFVERLLVLSDGEALGVADVERELKRTGEPEAGEPSPASSASPGSLDAHRQDAERSALVQALEKTGGNRTQAARLLGVSRSTLYNLIGSLGLDPG
jgi:DNA-binding NtrC family response regulator